MGLVHALEALSRCPQGTTLSTRFVLVLYAPGTCLPKFPSGRWPGDEVSVQADRALVKPCCGEKTTNAMTAPHANFAYVLMRLIGVLIHEESHVVV